MKHLRRVAVGLLMLAVMYVLVRNVRRDGAAAMDAWRGVSVQWSWIILASISAIVGQLIYVYGWIRLLADCGVALPPWPATRMFFASNLGRYLPGGKAWQMGIVGVMGDVEAGRVAVRDVAREVRAQVALGAKLYAAAETPL